MSNFCLHSKLKGQVNNDLLPVIDEVILQVRSLDTPTPTTQQIKLADSYGNETFELEIIGDGNFATTFGGESIGKTCTLSKDNTNTYFSNGDYIIKINNKYKIASLSNGVIRTGNIADFEYSPLASIYIRKLNASEPSDWAAPFVDKIVNLDNFNVYRCRMETGLCKFTLDKLNPEMTILDVANAEVVGSIDDIASTSFTTLIIKTAVGNSHVTGNFRTLYKETSATKITFGNCYDIEGTIEGFCEDSYGVRTSGYCLINVKNTSVTFNSNPVSSVATTIYFYADRIEVHDSYGIIGSYNGSEWTYV